MHVYFLHICHPYHIEEERKKKIIIELYYKIPSLLWIFSFVLHHCLFHHMFLQKNYFISFSILISFFFLSHFFYNTVIVTTNWVRVALPPPRQWYLFTTLHLQNVTSLYQRYAYIWERLGERWTQNRTERKDMKNDQYHYRHSYVSWFDQFIFSRNPQYLL